MTKRFTILTVTTFATMLGLGILMAVAPQAGGFAPTGTAVPVATPASSASVPVAPPRVTPSPGRVVYLTFDDGPDPHWTPAMLAVLARHHARATFFVLGDHAAEHPELVDRARAAGHTIGNHSMSHPNLTHLSAARITAPKAKEQPDMTLHHEVTGGVASRCFRPPYGATNTRVRTAVRNAGMTQKLWDVDPGDWRKPGSSAISRRILTGVGPGDVVLLHDGGGDRSQTVAALDQVLTRLTAQGYTFRPLAC